MKIIYEDAEVLVAIKPAGVESEEARGLESDMVNLVRKHLTVDGKGISYAGLIYRPDKPVTGLMFLGKTPAAVAVLSKELKVQKTEKCYRAIVLGKPVGKAGSFMDWTLQDKKTNLSRIVPAGMAEAKEARLRYRVLRGKFVAGKQMTEVKVELLTGRWHQVRAQLATHGFPLIGDRKYSSTIVKQKTLLCYGGLCLAATGFSFTQLKTRKKLSFAIEPPPKIVPRKSSINSLL